MPPPRRRARPRRAELRRAASHVGSARRSRALHAIPFATMDFQTHTIAAAVHGRFLVRPGPPERLLIGFHGYAETAEKHLEDLTKIRGGENWTVALVQALHPFYTARSQQVVAS